MEIKTCGDCVHADLCERDVTLPEFSRKNRAYCESFRAAASVPQWISVEDRLPDAFVSVLGYMTDAGEFPAVRECYRISDAEFYFPALFERHPVSHWMPMPEVTP